MKLSSIADKLHTDAGQLPVFDRGAAIPSEIAAYDDGFLGA
jgi:hypothetical protein